MARRYRLLARSFRDGALKERGEIVTLLPHERPGPHMVLVKDMPALPVQSRVTVNDECVWHRAPEPAPAPPPTAPAPIPVHPGYLILDTETNGFSDPRLASIAMIFTDGDFNVQHEYARLIRPDGWQMGEEAAKVNGLCHERLESEGLPVAAALDVYRLAVALGRTIVAHNLEFDLRVMANECDKSGSLIPPAAASICTMKRAREIGEKGTLAAMHEKLTGKPLLDAHDALVDARACLAVLRELFLRGAV